MGQLFIVFLPNYGARPDRASLSLPFCAVCPPLWRAARPRSEHSIGNSVIICLLFHLPNFVARGPSGPAYHCLLRNLPPLWRAACPRSERSQGGPVIICFLFHLPTFMARGPSRPAFHCLSAQFSPVMARGPSGPAYHCLSAQFAPVTARAARPRSGHSVGGPVIICRCFHLPTLFGARPERANFSLPFCPVFPRSGARPEQASLSFAVLLNLPPFWCTARAGQLINALLLFIARGPSASLSFARPERVRLSFALMPDLRCSPNRVKSTPWAGGGGGGDALLFFEGLQPLAHER